MKEIKLGEESTISISLGIEMPPDPDWLFGRFRLSANGRRVGDWGDVVTLKTVIGAWRCFLRTEPIRWDPALAAVDATEWHGVLDRAVYGDTSQQSIPEAYERFEISFLGASALEDVTVFLIEPPDSEFECLVWRERGRLTNDQSSPGLLRLRAGSMKTLGRDLLAAVSSYDEI